MYQLYPYYTNDGSVGLFSPDADDIYHSTYGALTEAYEKFILPANLDFYFKNYEEVKLLDICFGIGYNSKSFLNYFFENYEKNFYNKNNYNVPIHTNNIPANNFKILQKKNGVCIAKVDTNKISSKIFIHAVDTDKNLMYLSPFIKTGVKNIKNEKLSFEQEKISRMLNKKSKCKYKISRMVNIILLKSLIENNPEIFEDKDFRNILFDKKYSRYFDNYIAGLFNFYKNRGYNKTFIRRSNTFLHNIYYMYLSTSHKKALECLNLNKIKIKTEIRDARLALKESKNAYNIVFLDAFTPSKCPCLWTLEFFKEIYNHLDQNGIVLTYSNSANIRNAFLQAGFHVGKIFNKSNNKYTGTAAVKNKDLFRENSFITELSEYDLGLIKTKAGIIYRDENLSLDNEAIIALHKKEVESSPLMSSSKYIKTMRRNNEV